MFGLKSKLLRRYEAAIAELRQQVDILSQSSLDALARDPDSYGSVEAQVEGMLAKYRGVAEKGIEVVKRVVNVRRAFVLPKGVGLWAADAKGAGNEMAFLREHVDANNLNEALAQDYVRESELQGKVLVRLVWDDALKQVMHRYIPWDVYRYRIFVDASDARKITRFVYTDPRTKKEVTIPAEEAVFRAFNATLNSCDGAPTLGPVLHVCDNVSDALRDLRKLNRITATVTPWFETEDSETAEQIIKDIKARGWKIGMAYAGAKAKFSLVSPSGASSAVLENEIRLGMQIISGVSGVSLHFLGFPDMLSNRAVATEMNEPIEVASAADLTAWRGFYEEAFDKAIALWNREMNPEMRPGLVKPLLTNVSQKMWERVRDTWLPLFQAGAVSAERLLRELPDTDVEDEMKRLAERGAGAADENAG
jgi:hypothetical protein